MKLIFVANSMYMRRLTSNSANSDSRCVARDNLTDTGDTSQLNTKI